MAYDLKITVFNNRDYEQSFTLNNDDSTIMDLTGSKLIFAIGNQNKAIQTHDSSNATTNKCIFVTDAVNGQISLVLPYTVLKTLEAGNYVHDLILVDTDSKRKGVWSGQMIVKKGVAA